MAPTAGAPPPEAAPPGFYTTPSERQPFKVIGGARTFALEATPPFPWDENSEEIILEHEAKVNKYQATLAAYLNAKYFPSKASDKGGRSLLPHRAAVPKSRSRLPQANNSEAKDVVHEENWYIREAKDLDHEEKVNKYQAMLAARLKAKYFSSKAFDKGDTFEEITIQSETIRMSRSIKVLLRERGHQEDSASIVRNRQLIWLHETPGKWPLPMENT